MKKSLIWGLLLTPTILHAEVYLSRDFCSIDYSSLKIKKAQMTTEMFVEDINILISKIHSNTELSCLEHLRIPAVDNTSKRQTIKKETCAFLPNEYYADKNGNTIYRLSDRQLQSSENIIDGQRVGECLDPLLDY